MATTRRNEAPLDPPLCWTCWQAKQEEEARAVRAAEILASLEDWTTRHLQRAGLSRREIRAELHRIPGPIRNAMPKEVVRAMVAGDIPTAGFGLGGNTDGGKTMAVAALLKVHLEAWTKREIPKRGEGTPAWFRWANWPDTVQWLRAHAIDPSAPELVENLAHIPLLVLDDLGRERIKGSYTEDWAASQLDAIVNARYREERVTIWTTNVTEADLVNLYGAAMLRRLTADNPLTWIPDLRSAR